MYYKMACFSGGSTIIFFLMNDIPYRQIRAVFNNQTIRVYQAYSSSIAEAAVKACRFISPPFKIDRMTWIKPSFFWMMYRSGWATKPGQNRILAIDITRDGFEWALDHAILSHFEASTYKSYDDWLKIKETSPVCIQWDPERNIHLDKLNYRSIQIGLSQEATHKYVKEWTVGITDITSLCTKISSLINNQRPSEAIELLPKEKPYQIPQKLAHKIGVSSSSPDSTDQSRSV